MVSNSLKLEEIDDICRKIDEISQKIGVEMPYTYFLKLSTVYFSKGEYKKSLKMLNLAEDLAEEDAPLVPEIWLNQVEIFKTLGKNSDAIKYYKKYFEIYPNDTKVISEFIDFSKVLFKLSEKSEVAEVLEELVNVAQKIGVKMPYTPLLKLATVYFSKGEYKKSLKMLNLAEDLAEKDAPSLPEIWLKKVEIFKTLGENNDAIKYYKKYFEIYPNDTKVISEFVDFSKVLFKLLEKSEVAEVLENIGSASAAVKLRKEIDKMKREFLSHSTPIRILHVDDEPSDLEVTRILLRRESKDKFEIVDVLSVMEALDKLKEERFDVIVSDYKAPCMDGLEFLEAVRKSEKCADIPFILFSGKGGEEVAKEGFKKGADRYIPKAGVTATQCNDLTYAIIDLVKETKEKHRGIENISSSS